MYSSTREKRMSCFNECYNMQLGAKGWVWVVYSSQRDVHVMLIYSCNMHCISIVSVHLTWKAIDVTTIKLIKMKNIWLQWNSDINWSRVRNYRKQKYPSKCEFWMYRFWDRGGWEVNAVEERGGSECRTGWVLCAKWIIYDRDSRIQILRGLSAEFDFCGP